MLRAREGRMTGSTGAWVVVKTRTRQCPCLSRRYTRQCSSRSGLRPPPVELFLAQHRRSADRGPVQLKASGMGGRLSWLSQWGIEGCTIGMRLFSPDLSALLDQSSIRQRPLLRSAYVSAALTFVATNVSRAPRSVHPRPTHSRQTSLPRRTQTRRPGRTWCRRNADPRAFPVAAR